MDLLHVDRSSEFGDSNADYKAEIIVQTLNDFGVRGKVGEVHPGPVVTRYEYEPAAGVRVSQIVSRSDDISLALRAESIRIVAPIPGKAAVGIEIPNRTQAMISLKELLATDEFRHSPLDHPWLATGERRNQDRSWSTGLGRQWALVLRRDGRQIHIRAGPHLA